jgi:hypothetical protein
MKIKKLEDNFLKELMKAGAITRKRALRISELVRKETEYTGAKSPLLYGMILNRVYDSMNALEKRNFVNRVKIDGYTSFYLTEDGRDYFQRMNRSLNIRGGVRY